MGLYSNSTLHCRLFGSVEGKKNTKWKEQVPCAPRAAYKGYAELQWAVCVTSQLHCETEA